MPLTKPLAHSKVATLRLNLKLKNVWVMSLWHPSGKLSLWMPQLKFGNLLFVLCLALLLWHLGQQFASSKAHSRPRKRAPSEVEHSGARCKQKPKAPPISTLNPLPVFSSTHRNPITNYGRVVSKVKCLPQSPWPIQRLPHLGSS